ncbi:MAG: N-acetylmuramoyl-L-alanine amidase [Lachnospiraceae bacterium]|nr:N-acetylmuramoyl-L-alanine amidase [Lachnospiraceae bacterium]
MSFLLIFAMLLVAKESAELVKVWNQQEKQEKVTTVVIDAGHGGIDPGKVGVNDALEKDINLSIALKLKKYLEQQDIRVVMTRETDEGLYEESDSNKKVRDMKNRLDIMEKTAPALTISIHQNSYPEESVSGMQVFYYETSTEGKALAEIMQQTMIESLKPQKERTAKANDTYYLLKKTTVPIVIVECGFLSNRAEAELLVSSDYQEKMAWAIHMGVLRYLNQSEQ